MMMGAQCPQQPQSVGSGQKPLNHSADAFDVGGGGGG